MNHKLKCFILVFVVILLRPKIIYGDWPMAGANPERTSWCQDEVRGNLLVEWYRSIEPYVGYKVQVIAVNGKLFVSTARGLYCLDASYGTHLWTYGTEFPLGHSPTYVNGVLYVGCYDRRIHAINESDGNLKAGWTFYEAEAGFETNPLVVDAGQGLRVYAGSRDGYFYCLDANTGAFIWRYKTDGSICFSAAYKDGVIFFASNDAHAYAISDQGTSAKEEWKSVKLHVGEGFLTYWPVIYENYVIFPGSKKCGWGWLSGVPDVFTENYDISRSGIPAGLIGPTSTSVSGDWITGTTAIDASVLTELFEDNPDGDPVYHRPWLRNTFILDRATGQEYTFDSDDDGYAEYAPFTFSGQTHDGNKMPPIIGSDGVIYQMIGYEASGPDGWINGGFAIGISGWKFGTKYISRVANYWSVSDEPHALAGGGDLIYHRHYSRAAGSVDISTPYGGSNREWSIANHDSAWNFSSMYTCGIEYKCVYGYNGVYSLHGVQHPLIPYNGRVYNLAQNSLMALSTSGGENQLSTVGVSAQTVSESSPLSKTYLKQRLEEEIQQMISAGHLRTGYHNSGGWSFWCSRGYTSNIYYNDLWMDYFHNPADTLYVLVCALPHLSPSLQNDVKTYLQQEMTDYPVYDIAHIGWQGAQREIFDDTPEFATSASNKPARTQSQTPSHMFPYVWTFPQDSFYGAWKYAQVFPGEAKTIFDNMKSKLEPAFTSTRTDAHYSAYPYILNAYITGYRGYMELEKLAGYTTDITQSSKYTDYNNLLASRINNFSKDRGSDAMYMICMNVARNFMFLVPELADHMRNNILTEVQEAVNEYNDVASGWFVTKYDGVCGEGCQQHLYDYNAMFQAKALILQEPYEELVKYIDVPAFDRGDLFYILNVVTALDTVPTIPTRIMVEANPTMVEADGTSTSNITGKICDDAGRVIAGSTAEITFSITTGGGTLVGTNPISATNGVAAITYKSGTTEETVTITGTSAGLAQGTINITLVLNDAPLAPTDLLCNSQINPVNLSNFTPDLGWTFNDPDSGSGDSQSAYRILVADSLSNIDGNNGNIWDTNKVASADTSVAYAGTTLQTMGQYWWKVMTWDSFDSQGPYSQVATFTMADIDPRCYNGTPFTIPGMIEAEDYDNGGEGVAYHDSDSGNNGSQYRTTEGVDIENCGEGGYNVGYTVAGEWLEYTVDVTAAGTYTIEARVASSGTGHDIHIEFDGADKTGTMSIPDTGGWQTWQTISKTGVSLTAGKYIMRIVIDGGGSGNINYINIKAETVIPTITVTAPNGGERWIQDTQQLVTWTSGGGTISNVNIDLSTDGGTNWTSLAAGITNDGSETVTAPSDLSTTCKIRVEDVSGTPSDVSNNNFTIEEPPQSGVTVTAPNGGEAWTAGTQQVVAWTSQGSVGNVNIDLSTDGGVNWTTLVSGTTNDGSQVMTVPNSLSTACKVRVEDVSGSPSDTSNSNFTIEESPIPSSISVNKTILDFEEVEIGKSDTLDFQITNTGGGILSGSITTDKPWIEVQPTSFNSNTVTINVTVDNSILNQAEGQYTGKIDIISNGGDIDVAVQLAATCVLVKPNPYDPSKGNLTFFGDGIVPGQTTIKIYTLSGELVTVIPAEAGIQGIDSRIHGNDIVWDGTNEKGQTVSSGIYIYVYESPQERGIGKITVIIE